MPAGINGLRKVPTLVPGAWAASVIGALQPSVNASANRCMSVPVEIVRVVCGLTKCASAVNDP